MTDQIQQARRAAFEAWYNKQWTLCERCGNSKDIAWQGFSAGLDSLCIELPLMDCIVDEDGFMHDVMRAKDVRAAIEQTNMGITIK